MRLIVRLLTSRISNKIILPYLLLALGLVVAVSFVAVRLTAGALQSRLDNRLIEAVQALWLVQADLIAADTELGLAWARLGRAIGSYEAMIQ